MPDLIDDFQTAVAQKLDDSNQVHFVVLDANDVIRHISLSFTRVCGRKYFDLIQSPIKHLPIFVKDYEDQFVPFNESQIYKSITEHEAVDDRVILKNTQDTPVMFEFQQRPLIIQGQLFQLLLFVDQHLQDETFRKAEMHQKLFESSNEAIIITDAQPTILSVNSAFTAITGYEAEDVVGRNPSILSSGYHNGDYYKKLWRQLEIDGRWSGKFVNRRKSGELFSERCTIRAIYGEEGIVQNYVSIFSELSNSDKNGNNGESISIKHDDLTALPKRAILEDRADQAVSYASRHKQKVSVFYFNFDDFSRVNEKYDIKTGDKLIKAVVRSINQHIREDDTFSRVLGDEFAIVLRDLPLEYDDNDFALRLLSMISEAAYSVIPGEKISASIGISTYPEDQVKGVKLLRHAHVAMNIAKSEGGNCHVFFSTEKEKLKELARKAKNDVLDAIKKNQMQLFVQPQINFETDELTGAELLLRWFRQKDEIVYPDEFLNSQRDPELLDNVDRWVISEAVRLLETDLSSLVDRQLKIGINLTPHSLQNYEFHDWLFAKLKITDPAIVQCIEIEILENDALENIEMLKSLIASLTPIGVNFSLDDFGTGYSSLSIFNQLSVNTIKIDKSFVRDMVVDHKNLSLVKAICNMSQIFEREIIAEGVEYREQAELLKASGCDIIQGFGIAKPMPVAEFQKWIGHKTYSEDWSS